MKKLFCIVIVSLISSSTICMDLPAKRSALTAELALPDIYKKLKTGGPILCAKESEKESAALTEKIFTDKLLKVIREQDNNGLVEKLINIKANVNAQDRGGETPLFCAIRYNLDSVKTLIKHGSHVNTQNAEGMTPLLLMASLWYCEDYGDPEDDLPGSFVGSQTKHFKKIISTAKLLMESGTDTTLINENNDTVITLLQTPCDHFGVRGDICENCGVSHTCRTCTTSQQLLDAIQEQLTYRQQAPHIIRTTLGCYSSKWADPSSIIAGYLVSIAAPSQEPRSLTLEMPDADVSSASANTDTPFGTSVLGLDQE
ncbi:MAG: ankyrin repeat domain-containing protein [Candidatus Babeliales bacterium]